MELDVLHDSGGQWTHHQICRHGSAALQLALGTLRVNDHEIVGIADDGLANGALEHDKTILAVLEPALGRVGQVRHKHVQAIDLGGHQVRLLDQPSATDYFG